MKVGRKQYWVGFVFPGKLWATALGCLRSYLCDTAASMGLCQRAHCCLTKIVHWIFQGQVLFYLSLNSKAKFNAWNRKRLFNAEWCLLGHNWVSSASILCISHGSSVDMPYCVVLSKTIANVGNDFGCKIKCLAAEGEAQRDKSETWVMKSPFCLYHSSKRNIDISVHETRAKSSNKCAS